MKNTIDELFILPHDKNDTAIRRDTESNYTQSRITVSGILHGFFISIIGKRNL